MEGEERKIKRDADRKSGRSREMRAESGRDEDQGKLDKREMRGRSREMRIGRGKDQERYGQKVEEIGS
jgi:hypothetical protein